MRAPDGSIIKEADFEVADRDETIFVDVLPGEDPMPNHILELTTDTLKLDMNGVTHSLVRSD